MSPDEIFEMIIQSVTSSIEKTCNIFQFYTCCVVQKIFLCSLQFVQSFKYNFNIIGILDLLENYLPSKNTSMLSDEGPKCIIEHTS